ncbi:MAG: NAD-dependent epimerase/dehydratase family protein [Bacteroidales bacterium]|nr:NAD-dependent epimerase/dehydratase family protein [Bacteroidales bacterium]
MIMVTGATGFLGAHILYDLAGKGLRVKALYRDSLKITNVKKIFGYYRENISEFWNRIEWIEGDILDYYSLRENLKDIKVVYHAAGLVSFENRDREELNQINARGVAHVVNACLEQGIDKLCHVSSIATLGESNGSELIRETMMWNPVNSASAYAVSKFKGEMEVWRGIHEGLQAVIVNPSVIVGPGMWMGSARQILDRIRSGMKYYPGGSTGYVDVRDVATAMIRLTDGNFFSERYIVSSENLPHRTLLNLISDAMGVPRPAHPVTPCLMRMAVAAESIRSTFTGQVPRLTQKTLEIASAELAYSNKKIKDAITVSFIPIEESIQFSIPHFLAETALPV